MDAGGVDIALICAWQAPGRDMISNDEVAAFVAEYPDRLVGVGSVDFSKPMDAVREARRCVEELGFKAIRVLPWLCETPPSDRRFYPVYVACCQADVPFCTQIGHTGPLMPSEVGRPVYLDQVALDFPELTIVGGHIGYPWTEEAIAVATKHENVFIDTSAYTAARYPPVLVEYLKSHGRRKILFGTNYPMIQPKKALQDWRRLTWMRRHARCFCTAMLNVSSGFRPLLRRNHQGQRIRIGAGNFSGHVRCRDANVDPGRSCQRSYTLC